MNGVTFEKTVQVGSVPLPINIHTYDNWGLILKERPEISPPDPKTVYDDIPASDGVLDLTTSLTGFIAYDVRSIKMTFNVIHARERWTSLYSEILNFLQGQKVKIHFDEDPEFYYEGRVKVDEWKSSKRTSTLVISGIVNPYKISVNGIGDDYKWDPFNFETGAVRDYNNIDIDASESMQSITIIGSKKRVVPTFTVNSDDGKGFILMIQTGGLPVTFDTYTLSDGENRFPALMIGEGETTFYIDKPTRGTGTGTLSIDYEIGSL